MFVEKEQNPETHTHVHTPDIVYSVLMQPKAALLVRAIDELLNVLPDIVCQLLKQHLCLVVCEWSHDSRSLPRSCQHSSLVTFVVIRSFPIVLRTTVLLQPNPRLYGPGILDY